MPETVWDYVAKLKTSITKAGSRCRFIQMLFTGTVNALLFNVTPTFRNCV